MNRIVADLVEHSRYILTCLDTGVHIAEWDKKPLRLAIEAAPDDRVVYLLTCTDIRETIHISTHRTLEGAQKAAGEDELHTGGQDLEDEGPASALEWQEVPSMIPTWTADDGFTWTIVRMEVKD